MWATSRYTRGGKSCVLSETCHCYIISGWKEVFIVQTKCGHCLKIKEPERKKSKVQLCKY